MGDPEGSEEREEPEEPEERELTPRDRAKRLATRIRFLRMRERAANFENRESIRREIRRTEEELTRLAAEAEFEVDIDVRRER